MGAGALPETIWEFTDGVRVGSWAPGGQALTYAIRRRSDSGLDLGILDLTDEQRSIELAATEHVEMDAKFSPGGRFIAYISLETGATEVYIQNYPLDGFRARVSNSGGSSPLWSPEGDTLYYLEGDIVTQGTSSGRMMSVSVAEGERGPEVGPPQLLFEGFFQVTGTNGSLSAITSDGERFLLRTPAKIETGATEIVIVQNWAEELKRLAPTGKN